MLTDGTPSKSTPAFLRTHYNEDKRLHTLLEQTRAAVVLLDHQMNIQYNCIALWICGRRGLGGEVRISIEPESINAFR